MIKARQLEIEKFYTLIAVCMYVTLAVRVFNTVYHEKPSGELSLPWLPKERENEAAEDLGFQVFSSHRYRKHIGKFLTDFHT